MTKACYFISLSFLFILNIPAFSQHVQIDRVPTQEQIDLDGMITEKEWSDSYSIQIERTTDRIIDVHIKYDAENLYVAFAKLGGMGMTRHNAEILIKTDMVSSAWNENTYWFHSSYGNCYALGEYYIWEHCSTGHEGWGANTFPFKDENDNMEFRISFESLEMESPEKGSSIRIAFKISDAIESHSYWPKKASIKDPETWGMLIFN